MTVDHGGNKYIYIIPQYCSLRFRQITTTCMKTNDATTCRIWPMVDIGRLSDPGQ